MKFTDKFLRVFAGIITLLVLNVVLLGDVSSLGVSYGDVYKEALPGEVTCNEYNLFNSKTDDAEVSVALTANGELESLVDSITPESVNVRPGTDPSGAMSIKICFKIPEGVYQEESDCDNKLSYNGLVFATPAVSQGTSPVGSATVFSIGAPLEIAVKCPFGQPEPEPTDIQPVSESPRTNTNWIFLVILLVLIVAIIIVWVWKVKHPVVEFHDEE